MDATVTFTNYGILKLWPVKKFDKILGLHEIGLQTADITCALNGYKSGSCFLLWNWKEILKPFCQICLNVFCLWTERCSPIFCYCGQHRRYPPYFRNRWYHETFMERQWCTVLCQKIKRISTEWLGWIVSLQIYIYEALCLMLMKLICWCFCIYPMLFKNWDLVVCGTNCEF